MRCVDDVASLRTCDKGDTLVVAAVVRRNEDFDVLSRALDPDRVAAHFGTLVSGEVRRTDLPQLGAIVVLLPGVLGAGVTGTPVLDGHGKTLSYHVGTLPLAPEDLATYH